MTDADNPDPDNLNTDAADAAPTAVVDGARQYYYIFDSRNQRALILDPSTGDEYVWTEDRRVPLLRHVMASASPSRMRAFALDCARTTGIEDAPADSPAQRLWTMARDLVQTGYDEESEEGDDAPGASQMRDDVQAVRDAVSDDVVVALTGALPEKDPEAARLLAAHACTHPNVEHAAIDAMHMSERYAEFAVLNDDPDRDDGFSAASRPFLNEIRPTTPDTPVEAATAMRQRHVDRLLDLLP